MKIALEKLDARGLVVELPNAQSVTVTSAEGLRGLVDAEGDRVTASNVAADAIAVASLRVLLGSLLLQATNELRLETASASFERVGGRTAFDLAATARAAGLSIAVGTTKIDGSAVLEGAKLFVRDAEGTLSAERVTLTSFVLRLGEVELRADEVEGSRVEIGWGAAGFRLSAEALAAPGLSVRAGVARVALAGAKVRGLSIGADRVEVGAVTADKARLSLALERRSHSPAKATPPTESAEPLVDFSVLNALAGELNVDVAVDMRVPILGHRRATHRLRVPIEGGTLDYRALEDNLSKLENALLDFSVREGALVLERVNPLFPKRGHGKPIVYWPLDATDLELAEQERVRLAVLPEYRVVGADETPDEAEDDEAKKPIALQRLDLLGIDVHLALRPRAPVAVGHLRPLRAGALTVRGEIHHAGDGSSPPGKLEASASDLALAVHALPLGASRLDVAQVALAEVAPLLVAFAGTAPKQVAVEGGGVSVDGVAVTLAPKG